MVSIIYLLCAPILLGFASTVPVQDTKNVKGYNSGYLSDCPGKENPIQISKESLRKIRIKVIGAKATPSWIRRKYNYYQIKEMANDPTMDYGQKTILFMSGYFDNPDLPPSRIFESSYRMLGYNVWLVDIYKFVNYQFPQVARFAPVAGGHVGEMIYNLTLQNVGFDPKKLELLGLSLGGETISFIAKSFKALSGIKFSRLTALDPTGPCFRNLGPEYRLDQSDADYVEVVSTNMDGLGLATPVGHVNFYINGGEYQISDAYWIPCELLCSHVKVYTIWYSALRNPNSFIAMQCDSVQQARDMNCYDRQHLVTNLLGLNVNKTKHGIFYLATYHTYPYYMGEKGLKREFEPISNFFKELNKDDVIVV
ncbi:pancreatic lipase-related protein 2-like [Galleria mellonella]|uniref:Pancreatic lipase-related protein 2-like n=1 Tax=Galleria mellonella TaxID=7137 RepID=A0A6J1X7J0_GALME|nr:pancreatic lipase-related protein 2-like [Galleria mellonella]